MAWVGGFIRRRISNLRKNFFVAFFVFLAAAVVAIIIGAAHYQAVSQQLTLAVYAHRQTVASLSASAVKLKLDNLVGVAESLAAQDAVRAEIGNGQWDSAIREIESLSNNPAFYDSYIDRILLIDTSGIVRAAYPRLFGGVNARSVSFSGWGELLLQGETAFYVSDVYKRGAVPRINVVEVVAPVKVRSSVIGFVAMQVPIDRFSNFGKDTNIGSNGFAYFVDKEGYIVTHPKYSTDGPIIDYSAVPPVALLLSGEQGIGIFYNPIERVERVSAYELVPEYGWGVVSVEPIADAFADRDGILNRLALIIFAVCLEEFVAILLIFGFVSISSPKNESFAK